MLHTYRIEVDCANCANLVEAAARKTKGVASATVNFMTQKLHIAFQEGFRSEEVMERVLANCKKVEDSFELYL